MITDGLTPKKALFIKEYNKTGNGTRSAMKSYDVSSENSANVLANRLLKEPAVARRIKSIAERIPDDLLLKVHTDGLKATYDNVFEGKVISKSKDYSVRQRYLDTAYKLKGSYAPDKHVGIVGFGKIEEMSTEDLLKASESIDSVSSAIE